MFGRFLGAYFTLAVIFTSILLGAGWAAFCPASIRNGWRSRGCWPTDALSDCHAAQYLHLRRRLLHLAALTRRMLPVYISSVVMLIGYLVAPVWRATSTTRPWPR
jgi:hypothetical protein